MMLTVGGPKKRGWGHLEVTREERAGERMSACNATRKTPQDGHKSPPGPHKTVEANGKVGQGERDSCGGAKGAVSMRFYAKCDPQDFCSV